MSARSTELRLAVDSVAAIAQRTMELAQRVTASTEEVSATIQGMSLYAEDLGTATDQLALFAGEGAEVTAPDTLDVPVATPAH